MTQKLIESRPSPSTETPELLRVNPFQALFLQLDDLNITLQEVLRELRNRPTGHVLPISGVATGAVVREVLIPACFSLVVTNDGPDDLEFLVGEINQPYSVLNLRETLRLDFSGTVVDTLWLKSTGTASYRVFGIY